MSAVVRLAATCLLVLLGFAPSSAQAAGAGPAPAAWAPPPQDVPEGEIPVEPVMLDGHVLLRVRSVSTLPAGERAAAIEERIRELAEDPDFQPSMLQVQQVAGGGRIASTDGRLVMNVYDADGMAEGFSREGVSAAILGKISDAIADYRAARTPDALLHALLHAAGALLVLAGGLWLLLRTSQRLETRLENRFRARIPHLGIGSFQVLRAERMWAALRAVITLVRVAACLTLAFFCLRYMLARIPQTRGTADRLDVLVTGPLERLGVDALGLLPDLFFLLILFFVTRWLMRLTWLFFHAVEEGSVQLKGFEVEWAMPTYRLVRVALIAFALVVAYPYIPGAQSEAFKGISLFLGVLISIGSSSMISNIIAGYMLTYRRAFRIGDRVRIGDVVGDVTEVRLQATHVRTVKNESITIPNGVVLGSNVVNYSTFAATDGLLLSVSVGIGYETPWRQVEAMLLEAARRTQGLKLQPPPFVHQSELGDFAVTYELHAACDTPQRMLALRTELHRMVLDVFNEYGVQIMTPSYEGDPAEAKVVPRDRWFAAPAPKPPTG